MPPEGQEAGIAIARRELTATELRAAAGKTKDGRAARRMLAIALVLEGVDRTTAAQTCGMDRQTLRDWVHRYNAEGVTGLVNRTVPHRPRRLAPEQLAALAAGRRADAGNSGEEGKGRGRRSGITIGSFSCALECNFYTDECLTLVGTEGRPYRDCSEI